MANTIIPKRSSVAAKAPLATDLQIGEIAINLADGLIFSKNAAGTVITLGGSGGGGGTSLPSQTGNDGKFLTTDGTNPSWATPSFLSLTGGQVDGNVTITGGLGVGGAATRKLTVIGDTTEARILIRDSDSTYASAVAITEFGGTDGRGGFVGINVGTLQLFAEPDITDTVLYAAATERLRANASGVNVTGPLSATGTLGTIQANAFGDQVSFSKNGYNYVTASGAAATLQIQASGASGKIVLATAGADRITVGADGNVTVGGLVYSTSGGFKFPDGSIQTTASSAGGSGLPTGGTTGQALIKSSSTDYDVGWSDVVAASIGTASQLTLTDGYTEEVFTVTGTTPALSPTNGSIQTWTLTGASTPTAGTWASGQSITLLVDDGSARLISWASMSINWKTNSGLAPTLNTTGYTVIQLWKVGTQIFGARVGNA